MDTCWLFIYLTVCNRTYFTYARIHSLPTPVWNLPTAHEWKSWKIFFHFHPEFPTDGNCTPTCLTCDLHCALFLEADGVISNSRSAQKRAFNLTKAKSRAPGSDDDKSDTALLFVFAEIFSRGKRRCEDMAWGGLAVAAWGLAVNFEKIIISHQMTQKVGYPTPFGATVVAIIV